MNFKIKGIILPVVVSVLFTANIFAQSPSDRQNYLPKIIPNSPEAAMLQKFGNYNVNLFNGVPDISIPLYEINTGKLKVPITLSYHASGIKVRDDASYVGLGWNLSAGGAITRTVRSKADEQNGYLNGAHIIASPTSLDPLHNNSDLNYSNSIARGIIDVEPDIFSCNLPTINNKFYYGNRNVSQPVLIPFSSAKVNTTLSGNSLSFSVLDESGIEYKMGDISEVYSSGSSLESYPTAWNLRQMISDDKKETIYFNYVTNSYGYNGSGGDYYDLTTVIDQIENVQSPNECGYAGNCTGCPAVTSTTGGGQAYTIGSNVLQEIKFPQGKVVFELDGTNRLDMVNKSLKTIKIYSIDPVTLLYSLLKTYTFNYAYFVNGSEYRLKLTSIQLKDNVNVNIQTYTFTYNETTAMPLKNSRGRDYWGYFNNAANTSLIPVTDVVITSAGGFNPYTVGIGGIRDANPLYNQVGVLTKITFPTGGVSEFFYETNKYIDGSTIKNGGGLRISQIKSTDPVNNNLISYKTYKYGDAENDYGKIIIPINSTYFFCEQRFRTYYDIAQVTRRIRTYTSNPNVGLEPFDGNSVGYTTVTEYSGTTTDNIGKSVYQFNCPEDNYGYDLVEFNKPSIGSRYFERGELLAKKDYKNVSGTYKLLQEVTNSYGAWPTTYSTDAVNLRLFEAWTYKFQQVGDPSCAFAAQVYQPYSYGSYRITNGDNRLISSTQKVYNENDESKFTTTTTTYSYDNYAHKQLTKTKFFNTNGQKIETIMKYPGDITPTQPVLTNMIGANMINKVIDKELKIDDVSSSLTHTEYASFGTNQYYPSYITTKTYANTAEIEVTFNLYDALGNIVKYTPKDGMVNSFIWDYNFQYPVAKIIGASIEDCAYTSFESDGKGGWTFTGKPALDYSPPTGKKTYNLTLGTITKTITSTNSYTVSYWRPTSLSALTITGTQGAVTTGRTVNGWKYYEHKITGQTTATISGTGSIDELRLYPSSAVQMTTYTYDNLIGITSQCDPNNRISYYEYDGSQRLVLVRDQDKKILKKLCYNYAGEPENCNFYYNEQQGGIYTKSCGAGYIGSQVSYIIPAGIYSASTLADANAFATQDVQTNGQNYADANGVCTPGITVNGYNAKTSFNYNVKFTPTAGGTSYTFTLPKTTQFTYLGAVPSGNYSVQFFPAGSCTPATFVINGLSYYSSSCMYGGQYTFTNVNITSTSSAYMY